MKEQRWLEQRFCTFWKRGGLRGDPLAMYRIVVRRYGEAHRYYHTLEHIAQCLRELDRSIRLIGDPLAVEGALWFHDIVYDPRRADNEERSAQLAARILVRGGATKAFVANVRRLIMATRHAGMTRDRDAALLVDIDLSILGAERSLFDRYDQAIRKEYAFVPESAYRAGRGAILQKFLDRAELFQTAALRRRLKKQACENLKFSIARLSAAG